MIIKGLTNYRTTGKTLVYEVVKYNTGEINMRTRNISSTQDINPSRILDIDAIRAFALFGILVVNMGLFASVYSFFGVENPAFTSGLDHAATWIKTVFIDTKFYLLFSFLFGYSFTLQMESAERRGVKFVPRILRRSTGLFIIGLVHAIFFYHGDILRLYAVLGLILLVLRKIQPRTAFILAGLFIGGTAVLLGVSGLLMPSDPSTAADSAQSFAEATNSTAAFQGGPISVIMENIRLTPRNLMVWAISMTASALGAFLMGLAFGKKRLLVNVGKHPKTLRYIQYIGYPIGLIGAVIYATYGMSFDNVSASLLSLALDQLTAPFLTAAYVASLFSFFHSSRLGHWTASTLAPMGRTALTNYLLQSVICVFIFTGYGLGLTGQVSLVSVWIISVVVFLVQLVLSVIWMKRHQFGPVEWLLRAFTYLEWPLWKKRYLAKRGFEGNK